MGGRRHQRYWLMATPVGKVAATLVRFVAKMMVRLLSVGGSDRSKN